MKNKNDPLDIEVERIELIDSDKYDCLLYTSPSPRDRS